MARQLRKSVVVLAIVVLGVLGLVVSACENGSSSPTGPSPMPPATSFTVEVRGKAGATGSGLVSVYYPKFEPGAEHIGTCVVDPGSAACTYTIAHTTGTVELVANGVTGSTFNAWVGFCDLGTGNTCGVTVAPNSLRQIEATFSTAVPVRLAPAVQVRPPDLGNLTAVLHVDQNTPLALPSGAPAWLNFELPPGGGNITLSVQAGPDTVVTYLGADLEKLQNNVKVCDNHSAGTPAITCTFMLRPSEVMDGAPWSELDITVELAPASAAPPPPGRPSLSVLPDELRWGFVGIPYEDSFRGATGGTAPYLYSVTPSSLPPGVNHVDGPTDRRFGGTPQAAGTFNASVEAVDAVYGRATGTVAVPVAAPSVVNGRWLFTITVTNASDFCSSNVGSVETVSIFFGGASGLSSSFLASGFLGSPANRLTGTFYAPDPIPNRLPVILQGSYPEDGGQTTTTHTLSMSAPTEMSGLETWRWTNASGQSCTGRANVVAVKVP